MNLLPAAPPARLAVPLLTAALSATLAGCSTIEGFFGGDKVDYRSTAVKAQPLEVPPDLTQLARDARYQPQGGVISASGVRSPQAPAASASAAAGVAVASLDGMRIARDGQQRWLVSPQTPEQLWPQLKAFWEQRGLKVASDNAQTGVMETDWAENRAKLPLDFVRANIGKIFDGAYSTGELDKFRTRVERSGDGTDVYVTHRGMIEVYSNQLRDSTTWQPRAPDPQLEGELLSRLMLKLGATEEVAKTATVAPGATATSARARIVGTLPSTTLQVDDGFDRAWRRVGVALDRSGFTVEDRDRAQGLYFVRYVDPAFAGKEEPGFFSKLFSFGKKKDPGALARYRVSVKSEGERSTVSVLNNQGAPESGEAGKRITTLLLDELK